MRNLRLRRFMDVCRTKRLIKNILYLEKNEITRQGFTNT